MSKKPIGSYRGRVQSTLPREPIDTVILVSAHRLDQPFLSHPPYLPVHAGKALAMCDIPGTIGDNTGDSISARNSIYSDVSVHYWAWKNLPVDVRYVGLNQYRRYFDFELPVARVTQNPTEFFAHEHPTPDFEAIFEHYDVVLGAPMRHSCNNNYEQYVIHHQGESLLATRQVITDRHPDFLADFDQVMFHENSFWADNMFVFPRAIFDRYSAWLFDILLEVERRLDIRKDNAYWSRVLGFLSERMMTIYVRHFSLKVKEVALVFVDDPAAHPPMTLRQRIARLPGIRQWKKRSLKRRTKKFVRQFEKDHLTS